MTLLRLLGIYAYAFFVPGTLSNFPGIHDVDDAGGEMVQLAGKDKGWATAARRRLIRTIKSM